MKNQGRSDKENMAEGARGSGRGQAKTRIWQREAMVLKEAHSTVALHNSYILL